MNFIIDSGAIDHIVNKTLFSNFKKCENGVIKSANKNEFADIVIDGKGNLLLRADATGDVLKLTDVVAAKDILENLLSLRKLSDAGFSIYLDDKSLRVYNKTTNKTILEGIYEKPNWVVNFEVIKSNDDLEFEKYSCNARIDSYQELPEQPHTSIQIMSFGRRN